MRFKLTIHANILHAASFRMVSMHSASEVPFPDNRLTLTMLTPASKYFMAASMSFPVVTTRALFLPDLGLKVSNTCFQDCSSFAFSG